MDALTQPLALLALPVVLWLLSPAPTQRFPVHPAAEALGVVLLSAAVTTATTAWLWAWHALGGPYTSSDFSNYCSSIAAWNSGVPLEQLGSAGWHLTRSVAAGLLPSVLAPHVGTLNGLVIGAWTGCAATLCGLYVWGRALHSPAAGVAALVLAAALPSFAILTHSTNFYPPMVALLVWSAAGAAVALRWPTLGGIAVGAAGACLAFLADTRGLIWGLSATGLVGLAVLQAPVRHWPRRFAVLGGILVLGWWAGSLAFPPGSYPLEGDVDARRLYWDLGYRDPRYAPPWERDHAYVWGRSPVLDIPKTLAFLWEQRSVPAPDHPPEVGGVQANPTLTPARLEPWWRLGLGAAALAALSLLRRRRALLALAGLAPFAASLLGARDTVEAHPRFVITGTIAIPVVVGVAMAGLAAGLDRALASPATRLLSPRGVLLRPGLAAVLCWLLAAGILPSVLSPAHPDRVAFAAEDGWVREYFEGAPPDGFIPGEKERCRALFDQEEAQGRVPRGTLLDATRVRRRGGP